MDVLDANTGRLVLLEFTAPHLHEQELGRDEHSELMLPRQQLIPKMLASIPGCNVGGTTLGRNPSVVSGQCSKVFPLLHSSLLDPQEHWDLPSADTLSSRIQLCSQQLEHFCISGPSLQGLPAPHPPHIHPAAVPGSTVPATRTLCPS